MDAFVSGQFINKCVVSNVISMEDFDDENGDASQLASFFSKVSIYYCEWFHMESGMEKWFGVILSVPIYFALIYELCTKEQMLTIYLVIWLTFADVSACVRKSPLHKIHKIDFKVLHFDEM